MINKEVFKIALNTKNFGSLNNHTHFSSLKNPMCGDQIKIYLILKKDKITKFKYEGNSCIYCQASASLLAKTVKNKSVNKINNFIKKANSLFSKKIRLSDKKWKVFLKIMNKNNSSRKECLLLPLKATIKALKN